MTKKAPSKKIKKTTPSVRKAASKHLWIDDVNQFLERHFGKVLAVLFVISISISVIYYLQSRESPIMTVYKWQNSDLAFFDTWAKEIAAGDWIGSKPLHPYHDWHDMMAAEYFTQFPETANTYNYNPADSIQSDLAKRALINDMYKGKTFHQEPLYSYMLGLTYAVFGYNHFWVYCWQMLLVAFTVLLVFLIGRHFFGSFTGLLAALFVALCGSILVFQLVLLRTTLTNFLTVLLLYAFIRVSDSDKRKDYILFGLVSGIALLGQSYLMLFVIPAFGWLLWTKRKELRKTAINTAIAAGVLLIVLSPLIIRNISVGVPAFALASNAAVTYIPNNVEQTYPMESFYLNIPLLTTMMHDTDGKISRAVFQCLSTFDNFGSFWNIYKQKLQGLFMSYEIPNNMNYYLYREIAPILKFTPVHYFFIAPLGIAGMLLGLYRYRWRFMPILWMTLVSIVPMIIAGNMARYRTPLVIIMMICAAYFIIEIIRLIDQKKMKLAFVSIGVLLLAFVFSSTASPKNQFVFLSSDLKTFYTYYYYEKLFQYQNENNYQKYLELTTDMVENLPDHYFKVDVTDPIIKGNEAQTSRQVAAYLSSHLNILKYLNMTAEAERIQKRMDILEARAAEFDRKAATQ